MISCIGKYNISANNPRNRQKITFGAKPVSEQAALYYINKIKNSGAKKIYLFGIPRSITMHSAPCSPFHICLKK